MEDAAGVDAEPEPDAAPELPWSLRRAPAPETLEALRPRACLRGDPTTREECAVASYRKLWEARALLGRDPMVFADVVTATYRGELYTVHGFGTSVRALALEAFARFFWRAMSRAEISDERLIVFMGAIHAFYLYGPPGLRLRDAYVTPEPGLRELVADAIDDADHQLGARPGRPVDWANWGQGKAGFTDFLDGVVAGTRVPLVIRYCSLAGGFDYVFALVAPGQADSGRRPPSTSGAPVPGDPTCGVYVQDCPACD